MIYPQQMDGSMLKMVVLQGLHRNFEPGADQESLQGAHQATETDNMISRLERWRHARSLCYRYLR